LPVLAISEEAEVEPNTVAKKRCILPCIIVPFCTSSGRIHRYRYLDGQCPEMVENRWAPSRGYISRKVYANLSIVSILLRVSRVYHSHINIYYSTLPPSSPLKKGNSQMKGSVGQPGS
jgi:hypothetical protein